MRIFACALAALLWLPSPGLRAQPGGFAPYFTALRWRSIGPLRGGRSIAAAGSAARPLEDPLNFPPKLNNKIAVLLGVVDSGDGKPTEQSYSVFRQLSVALAAEQSRLEALVARDLAAFNARLARLGQAPVS